MRRKEHLAAGLDKWAFRKKSERDSPLKSTKYFGLWYNGITHASGACNPGSIPGSPTKNVFDKSLLADYNNI